MRNHGYADCGRAMNAATVRDAIKASVQYSKKHEPVDTDRRACCFVAALSGMLLNQDPDLSDVVWEVLDRPGAVIAAALLVASAG